MARKQQIDRWYPTQGQLTDPSALERTLRQVLTQHYALQDQVAEMQRPQHAQGSPTTVLDRHSTEASNTPPPGSGPSDSMLLGLRVAPVDVRVLADGARLTFVKASGNFQFK